MLDNTRNVCPACKGESLKYPPLVAEDGLQPPYTKCYVCKRFILLPAARHQKSWASKPEQKIGPQENFPPKSSSGTRETPEVTAAREAEMARRQSLKPKTIPVRRDYWAEAMAAARQAEKDISKWTGY